MPPRTRVAAICAVLSACLAAAAVSSWAQEAASAPVEALAGPAGPPGLTVVYHEGDFDTVLDLAADRAVSERIATSFALPDYVRADRFGLEYRGAIEVRAEGVYTFFTTSDDGSRLYIGPVLVVNNDYPHGATEKSGSLHLAAGRYPIYVGYFEGLVDQVLEVQWEGPGIAKGPIPAEALSQSPKVVEFPADAVTTTELEWPALGQRLTVTVDTRDAPDLKAFQQVIPEVLRAQYPLMLSLLAVEGQPLPTEVRFCVRPGIGNPAYASGSRIVLSAEWFTQNPGDLGCFVHEMAHLVQGYRDVPNGSGWVVEGIADYVRYKVGADDRWTIPPSYREGSSYTNGYGVAAAFLVYVERHYGEGLVAKLNRALKEGAYTDDLFREVTGKALGDLWEEYRQKSAEDAPAAPKPGG